LTPEGMTTGSGAGPAFALVVWDAAFTAPHTAHSLVRRHSSGCIRCPEASPTFSRHGGAMLRMDGGSIDWGGSLCPLTWCARPLRTVRQRTSARVSNMLRGQHHHVSPQHLHWYASHAAWMESHRRLDNGALARNALGLALAHPVSREWKGYWQHRAREGPNY